MFVETRDESRQYFLKVWEKMSRNEALGPLESIIARTIAEHPEYHRLLDQAEAVLSQDFEAGEMAANPFLHMGLHVALSEQLQTDRPAGIRALYQRILAQEPDNRHALEHGIIECLRAALWQAGQSGIAPDDARYLACVRQLLR